MTAPLNAHIDRDNENGGVPVSRFLSGVFLFCLLVCVACAPKCYYAKVVPMNWPTDQAKGGDQPITVLRAFVLEGASALPVQRDSTITIHNLRKGMHPQQIKVGIKDERYTTSCDFSTRGEKSTPWVVRVTLPEKGIPIVEPDTTGGKTEGYGPVWR
jgi:hypothetical protein